MFFPLRTGFPRSDAEDGRHVHMIAAKPFDFAPFEQWHFTIPRSCDPWSLPNARGDRPGPGSRGNLLQRGNDDDEDTLSTNWFYECVQVWSSVFILSEINKRNKKLRPSILRFCAMFHGLHAWNPSTTQCVITFNMSHQSGWPVDEAARPPILVSKKQVDSQTFDHASVRCSQARGTRIRCRFWPLWTVGRFWTSMVHLEQWQLLALIWFWVRVLALKHPTGNMLTPRAWWGWTSTMKIADLKITVDSSGEDELVRNPSSSSVLMQCLGDAVLW